ncbi:hypothetical protein ACPCAE_33335 [Streptomyces cinereoruber]|uniref:hypothetical protein n=1 Tax=Streptomyces cinereoruber TaxID=67260 RepID=UPI003C2AD02F
MTNRPAGDLYRRYMAAFDAAQRHVRTCEACQPGQACTTGAPLDERLTRLQAAWIEHLGTRRS